MPESVVDGVIMPAPPKERLRAGKRSLLNLDVGSELHAWFRGYAERHGTKMTKLLVDHIMYLKRRELSEKEALDTLQKDVVEGDVFLLRRQGDEIVFKRARAVEPSPVPDPNSTKLLPRRKPGRPGRAKKTPYATMPVDGQFKQDPVVVSEIKEEAENGSAENSRPVEGA